MGGKEGVEEEGRRGKKEEKNELTALPKSSWGSRDFCEVRLRRVHLADSPM
jgi:hypothetical protein